MEEALVDWSRAQFALTAMYHWLFVPLTLGLSFIMAIMETIYYKTGNVKWKKTTQFWMTLFGINFAIGVATGIILEFEFGTNWSNYSWFVGDIFGAPLAIEGIMAFFLESAFLAVMFFGWEKVSKKLHLTATWLVALGSNLSALWILVANAWMQNPVGMHFNANTVRNEMSNFWDVLLNPTAIDKFLHTISSGYVIGSLFVVGISSWYILKNRHVFFARRSILVGSIFGIISSLFIVVTGDSSGHHVAKTQPMKLAAMEGLYEGKEGANLVAFGVLNPEKTVSNDEDAFHFRISIPRLLSLLADRDIDAFVPGMQDLVYGNEKYNIPSTREKMKRGEKALNALRAYNETTKKSEGEVADRDEAPGSKKDTARGRDPMAAAQKNPAEGKMVFDATQAGTDSDTLAASPQAGARQHLQIFRENYPYMGYGYFEKPEEAVPPIGLTFYSFHFMVILGFFFVLLFVLLIWKNLNETITRQRYLLKAALWSIPLGYLASMLGWVVSEVGRQPWTIQDLLPVKVSTSHLNAANVELTFWLFAVIFTVLLIAEISIMVRQIKIGPKIN
jgi:cytochrome d ubiquinol oxidase subunit I